MATIKGTDGPDNLGPFATGDVYLAKDGNDTIDAGTRPAVEFGPIDVVHGGDGTDLLVVDASAESQFVNLTLAGSPRFFVRSGSGNFYIDGANDIETIDFTSGGGDDYIDTGSFGVAVNGGAGTDHWLSDLSAATGNIFFQLGTTTSIAAAGLTSILGIERITMATGSGDDSITGGSLGDTISAGGGDDIIDAKTRPSDGSAGVDAVNGGDGTDTLVVDASTETLAVNLSLAGSPRYFVRSDSGNFYVDGANDIEKISFTGGSGDDSINTGSFGILVNGGAGTDYWVSDLSALTSNVFYDVATTHAIAAAGLTSILGIERITMATGSGDDSITGGSLGDTISTGGGDDIIDAKTRPSDGSAGVDVVNGGTGTDTLVVDASAETLAVNLSLAGSPRYFVRSRFGQLLRRWRQ